MRLWTKRIARDSEGATAIEYGLIAGLIAVACVGAFKNFGNSEGSLWNFVQNSTVNAMANN